MGKHFILLHNDDTVLVCIAPALACSNIVLDNRTLTLSSDIEVGHKIARCALCVGDKVIKYGAPIGSMTQMAEAGQHVHIHNMKSDYIVNHTRRSDLI